jgi:hypothetical protein
MLPKHHARRREDQEDGREDVVTSMPHPLYIDAVVQAPELAEKSRIRGAVQ